jgi:hypothetical protein
MSLKWQTWQICLVASGADPALSGGASRVPTGPTIVPGQSAVTAATPTIYPAPQFAPQQQVGYMPPAQPAQQAPPVQQVPAEWPAPDAANGPWRAGQLWGGTSHVGSVRGDPPSRQRGPSRLDPAGQPAPQHAQGRGCPIPNITSEWGWW